MLEGFLGGSGGWLELLGWGGSQDGEMLGLFGLTGGGGGPFLGKCGAGCDGFSDGRGGGEPVDK